MSVITQSFSKSQNWANIGLSIFGITGMALATAVAGKVTIELPFTPVPITLQSMMVLLTGALLGAYRGAAAQVFLIGLGMAGLPVFSKPLPGLIVLMGPTGGYILGFVLAAFAAGWAFENLKLDSLWKSSVAMFLASLFIFLPGVAWLSMYTGKNLWTALSLGFVPFLVGDVIKCVAAAALVRSTANK